jgi:pyruvate/2-oxoglutarate dehydrogenase complex dihydrolipoamide acyltransferase (E2) component
VVLTVATTELTEPAYRLGAFAGEVSLLVESQEGAFVLALLAAEGAELPAGAPVAVLIDADAEGAAEAAAAAAADAASSSGRGGGGGGISGGGAGTGEGGRQQRALALPACPTTNVYDEAQPRVRVLEWQSYLAAPTDRGGGGAACMG